MRNLKYSAGSTETIFWISTKCSCWDLWQILLQIVLEALFIFNMIHWICSNSCGRVVHFELLASSKTQGGSPSRDRKCDLTEIKQACPQCHINRLLTTLAGTSRTGEYWPSGILYACSVRTATTSGQYSPVRPSCSISKKLIFGRFLPSWVWDACDLREDYDVINGFILKLKLIRRCHNPSESKVCQSKLQNWGLEDHWISKTCVTRWIYMLNWIEFANCSRSQTANLYCNIAKLSG